MEGIGNGRDVVGGGGGGGIKYRNSCVEWDLLPHSLLGREVDIL